MDLDEVESTGFHSHDRLTGTSPSAAGGRNDGWACYLLRRGWDLTRKAAIAGAAATAAPVVAPPLIVLSAAGVALSVPFAAYLASLAVTNHVMGALLRCPAPQPYHHQEEDDDDVGQVFLDASEEYGWEEAPAFGHLDTETEQGEEEDEGDTRPLLLRRPHAISEALPPAFADDEVEEQEEEGGISARESGKDSYTSSRGDEAEGRTPVEETEAVPRSFGFGVPVSAEPLFAGADNRVQKEGEGDLSVLDSGQQPFQPKNWNEKWGDVYSENKQEDAKTAEQNESTNEKLPQGVSSPELRVPASGGDDNAVQEKGEGEFSVQNSGRQSAESKNWNEKEEEDGRTTEENKSADETLSQGFFFPEFRVPASGDKDDADQEKGDGEFSAQSLGQYSLLSSIGDKKEQSITIEKKKSTEDMPQRDTVASESSVPVFRGEDDGVQSKDGFEVPEQEVLKEANSNTDLVMSGVAAVQTEIISIAVAAPESGVLPASNLAARESQMDLVTGEVVDVDVGIAAAAEPESEVLHPTSESLAGPVTEESVDAQVVIVAAAVPGSEVLPLSGLAACESQVVAETAHVGEAIGITVMEEIVRDFGDLSKEEDVKALEENKSKSSNETVSQGFCFPESRVPSSGDNDKVVQDKGGGEFSAQNSGQYSLSSNARYKMKQDITEENKYAGDMTLRDFVVSGSLVPVLHGEDDVVQSNKGFEVDVKEVAEEANSVADLVTGEAADVQLEIVAIAAPESEVLPPSNLVACESPADLVTGEVVDVCASIAAALEPESEVLHPSNLATSESTTGPVTEEIVDVQVDIVAAVTPGSEVLPLSSLAACESQEVAEIARVGEVTGITVMGEVAEVQVGIIAIAAPETESEVLPPSNVVARELLSDFAAAVSGSEVLHPGNLATSESTADPVTREIVAAAPESEVLPLTSLAACESQALAETAHVGEVIGITVTEDIVMDIGDVNKEGVSFVPVLPPHDGEDVMSSGSTPYLSTVEEEMIDQPNQLTGVSYTVTDEAFESRDVAGGEADYTEEQLREQLDTIRTITGYGAAPSSTLEGELAGLYIFVGVEPTVDSVDTSDRLMELNAKLRFLKSIIGVD